MELSLLLMLVTTLNGLFLTDGADRQLSCAVCRAVVDEINYAISKVDPKKTIQVGSFRVDPKGNQKTYEKPFARSEVHLIELFEGVCENFRDYAETKNEAGGRSVGRTKARDGKVLALKDISISSGVQKELTYICESLVEDHEDDMIALFGRDGLPDLEKKICGDVTRQCSEADLQIPMPVTEYESEDLAKVREAAEQNIKNVDDDDDASGDDEKVVMSDGDPASAPSVLDKEDL